MTGSSGSNFYFKLMLQRWWWLESQPKICILSVMMLDTILLTLFLL